MDNAEIIDMDELQNVRTLLKDKFPEIVEGYLEDAENYFAGLREGVEQNDIAKMAQYAHPLKSSSAALGIVCAHKLAIEIENKAKAGEPIAAIAPLVEMLEVELNKVKPILEGLLTV